MKLSQLFCVYLFTLSSLSKAMDVVPTNPPLSVLSIQTEHPEQLLVVPALEQLPDIVCIQHKGEDLDKTVLDQLEKNLAHNYLLARQKTISTLLKPTTSLGSTINIIAYKKDSLKLPKTGTSYTAHSGLSNWINVPLIRLSNGNEVHIVSAMPKKDLLFGEESINQSIYREINQFATTKNHTVIAVAQFPVQANNQSDLTILSKSIAYKLGIQKLRLVKDE